MTGILINARLASTRLKKKHLLRINDKPIITYLIQRIRRKVDNPIVVVTGNYDDNKAFEHIHCTFFGDDDNIPQRQYDAMEYFGYDSCVSVDGDDIFCSPAQIKIIIDVLRYSESVRSTGLPFGMNAFGYTLEFLSERLMQGKQDFNWIDGWIFDLIFHQFIAENDIRMTLDYKEDFDFFEAVIKRLGDTIYDISDRELIDHIEKFQLYKINEGVV